jgi:uncharacterized protein YdbL (DUF1318 family)
MNTTRRSFIVMLLALALVPSLAGAAASREDELKERFKERYPKLVELKKAGTIGETFQGYVELVDEKSKDKDAKALVEDENKDRKELYKLIAEKEGTTADVVAQRNARRVFEKAKPGEYLKGEDGKWKQKEAAPAK